MCSNSSTNSSCNTGDDINSGSCNNGNNVAIGVVVVKDAAVAVDDIIIK